jgi:hypothetical protein
MSTVARTTRLLRPSATSRAHAGSRGQYVHPASRLLERSCRAAALAAVRSCDPSAGADFGEPCRLRPGRYTETDARRIAAPEYERPQALEHDDGRRTGKTSRRLTSEAAPDFHKAMWADTLEVLAGGRLYAFDLRSQISGWHDTLRPPARQVAAGAPPREMNVRRESSPREPKHDMALTGKPSPIGSDPSGSGNSSRLPAGIDGCLRSSRLV